MQMRFGKSMVRAHTRTVNGQAILIPAHRRTDHGTLPRARMKTNPQMTITPEDLERRFGPEADRFHLRDKDDKPLLVRRFGRGKQHAFAVHDADGSHIATMHVKAHKDGAHVSGAWTHDKHNRRGVHNALLHRLVSHHGTVTSPTSMHHDLHRSFNTMDDDHELATERDADKAGVRYRLHRKQMTLFKGRVKSHWRKLPSGKVVRVQEYTNKRTRRPSNAPAAGPGQQTLDLSPRRRPAVLYNRAPRDVATPIDLQVDVAEVWRLYAEKTYGSEFECGRMAIREAFQNARDAVAKAGKGKIEIAIEPLGGAASMRDTGVGMDADTLEHKFLTLGASGKRGQEGMVGGFGVAKAVILGGGGRSPDTTWSIRTRDLEFSSMELGEATEFRRVEPIQGTEIAWQNTTQNAASGMAHAVRTLLAWSDLGKGLSVDAKLGRFLDAQKVRSMDLSRTRAFATTTVNGCKITIRQVKPSKFEDREGYLAPIRNDGICYRLNGLAQTWDWAPCDGTWVVDIETDETPGAENYPFDSHRAHVKAFVSKWVNDQLQPLASETLSGGNLEVNRPTDAYVQGDLEARKAWLRSAAAPAYASLEEYVMAGRRRGRNLGIDTVFSGPLKNIDWRQSTLSLFVANAKKAPGAGTTYRTDAADANEQAIDTGARYGIYADATNAGDSRYVSQDQAIGLAIAEWYANAVLCALTGHVPQTTFAAVHGSASKDAVATYTTTMHGKSIGFNLTYLSEAMKHPDALDMFLQAEIIHEITHETCNYHNEEFSSTMGAYQRALWPVRGMLLEETRRLWRAYRHPERAAGEAPATTAPQAPKAPAKRLTAAQRAAQKAEAAGQLSMFKSLAGGRALTWAPAPIRRYVARLLRELQATGEPHAERLAGYAASMLIAAWSTFKQDIPAGAAERLRNRYAVEIAHVLGDTPAARYDAVRAAVDAVTGSRVEKSIVRSHTRALPSGKVVQVNQYTNKRTKKAPPAASAPYSVRVAPGREHEVTPADAHAVNRHLQVALDWIARAHNLPKLDMTVQYGPMGAQEPGMTAAEYDRDRHTMLLSHDAPSTIVHEMAHAIDHQVLGLNRTFGTERWEQWVDQDRAMPGNLQGLSAVMDSLAPQSWQQRIRGFVDTLSDADADYVARPSEVFARAYEQYVYTKAARKPADNIDEGRLMLFARMVRTQALVDKGLYWTDEEFGPIEQAFDKLFAGGGITKAFRRLVAGAVDLLKGRVKGHWRTTDTGRMVWVSDYQTKRTKQPEPLPAGPQGSLFDILEAVPTAPAQGSLFDPPPAPTGPQPEKQPADPAPGSKEAIDRDWVGKTAIVREPVLYSDPGGGMLRRSGHERSLPKGLQVRIDKTAKWTDPRTNETGVTVFVTWDLGDGSDRRAMGTIDAKHLGKLDLDQPAPAPAPGPDLELNVQAATPIPDGRQTRKQFRDTGEKIGGARKDIQEARKRFEDELTASALADLEQQDPDAAGRVVTRNKIWSKPSIAAWQDEGRDARWIALARVTYDAIGARPTTDTPEGRRAYFEGVQVVHELVESSADHKDLGDKLKDLSVTLRDVSRSLRGGTYHSGAPVVATEYQKALAAQILSMGKFSEWLNSRRRVKGNGLSGWMYNLNQIWPRHPEDKQWRAIEQWWPSEPRKRTTGGKPEDKWRPSAPAEYERLGNPPPIEVRDASVFIDTFGVRGVEFGNWMDDAASSVHVNRCAEAFADLADGLGLDRRQVSINGRLALAFGARGGGNFLAHYEPGKVVINLTKLGGAGSLAHEWAHFLDHMIGKLELGMPAGHATEMGMGPVMPDDPPVVAALRRVMNAIYTGRVDGTWQRSEFFEVSKKRGEYWRKPWELFARAFECYVVDALAEKGRGNNYLAYDKSLRSPKAPYPRDKEREALKEAFDGLIEAIRQANTLHKAMRRFA